MRSRLSERRALTNLPYRSREDDEIDVERKRHAASLTLLTAVAITLLPFNAHWQVFPIYVIDKYFRQAMDKKLRL